MIVALLGGREALCTHGRQIRSFLHVADVGAAFAALLDSDPGAAKAIASSQETSRQASPIVSRIIGLRTRSLWLA